MKRRHFKGCCHTPCSHVLGSISTAAGLLLELQGNPQLVLTQCSQGCSRALGYRAEFVLVLPKAAFLPEELSLTCVHWSPGCGGEKRAAPQLIGILTSRAWPRHTAV